MYKTSKNKYSISLTTILALSILLALIPTASVKAASGTYTLNPIKYATGVPTTAVVNGGTFGAGATVYVYFSLDNTFTAGDVLAGQATIPFGATTATNLVVTLTAPAVVATTTYYVATTDATPAQVAAGTATWTTAVTTTVVTTKPTINIITASPGDSVTVTGTGFTAGSALTVYLLSPAGTVLATGTAPSVTFTVPNMAQGAYKIIVQQADTLQTEWNDAAATTAAPLTIIPAVRTPFDIAGISGEVFTITAVGLKAGKTLTASTVLAPSGAVTVGAIGTYHSGGTTAADGTVTITVTLQAAIAATGFAAVVFTYSVVDATADDGANMVILVSKAQNPLAPDYSQVLVGSPVAGAVAKGSTLTITVYNFPASTSVNLYFGPTLIKTVTTDSLGAVKTTATVPTLPGLDTAAAVIAYDLKAIDSYGIQKIIAGYSITRTFTLSRADTGATIIDTTYVDGGVTVTVTASGLQALKSYTVTPPYGLTAITITSDSTGAFTTTFVATTANPTGTVETVTLTPSTNVYVAAPTFLSVGVPVFTTGAAYATTATTTGTGLSFVHVTTGATTAAGDIIVSNLVPNTKYQLFISGALQVLGIVSVGSADSVTSSAAGIATGYQVSAPTTSGISTLSVRYYPATGLPTADLATIDLIASAPAGTDTAILTTTSISSSGTITIKGYNLAASTVTNIYVSDPDLGILASGTTTTTGAIEITSIAVNLPAGSYNVRVNYGTTNLVSTPATVTVGATFAIASTSGVMGSVVAVTGTGLTPNTAYSILFDSTALGIVGVSSTVGGLAGAFTVPNKLTGAYTVKLVQSSDTTVVIGSKTYTIALPTGWSITGSAQSFIPLQTVKIRFDSSGVAGWTIAGSTIKAAIDTYPIQVVSADDGVKYVYGTFTMPNGAAGTLTLSLIATDTSAPAKTVTVAILIERIEGSGAFIVGTSGDIAYIKTKVDTISASITDLNATIIDISDGVATIQTDIGTMSATLDDIDANVVSIDGDVATVVTDLGTIKTNVSNLPTSLTTLQTTATAAQTAATAAQTAASAAQTAANAAQSTASGLTSLIYAAIVLSLIAAIAAIFAVVQLQRKVAG